MNIAADGTRVSAARAFLHPALSRPNLTLLLNTVVVKLNFKGTRCVGVKIVTGGTVTDIAADKEVILAAGSINSPKLLMLSGVGRSDGASRARNRRRREPARRWRESTGPCGRVRHRFQVQRQDAGSTDRQQCRRGRGLLVEQPNKRYRHQSCPLATTERYTRSRRALWYAPWGPIHDYARICFGTHPSRSIQQIPAIPPRTSTATAGRRPLPKDLPK